MRPLLKITLVTISILALSSALAQEATKKPTIKLFKKASPLSKNAKTHNWTSFLGPTHNAVSTESKILFQWPKEGPGLVWRMEKGNGYSSPAISGEHLVYFHRVNNSEVVVCLNPETGAFRWQLPYPTTYKDRFGYSNGPRTSPVIEGDRVFTFGAQGKLKALELRTGKVLWARDLHKEFKVKTGFFGVAATPLVTENGLIINLGAPKANMVCLDKSNGKTKWSTGDKWGASYASPVPATLHGKKRLLIFAGGESTPPHGGLICLDPKNGQIDSRFSWRSKSTESVNAANPIVIGNKVFITASYKTGGALLSFSEDLKIIKADWTTKNFGAHFNTPVHHKGYLYGFDGRHIRTSELVCFRVTDGKEMWRETLTWKDTITRNGGTQEIEMNPARGTLLKVGERFLCLGEFGHLISLDLSDKGPKVISRKKLFFAPETWSVPVLSRGLLYVSQHSQSRDSKTPALYCYDLRGK
ncbi:MAG: PQQ-like beta-propeller repeat protein [Planctomycetota bacterium]|nr:PQQ-like beta-propeller repeat protein [Planctomycetota bacterium]